jgi:uncharacterized protein (DUF1330 family)
LSAYYFVDVREISDADAMKRHERAVYPTVASFGGRYLTVGGQTEGVEGAWRPTFAVLLEFPSLKQARDWYDSDAYRPLKALRLAATKGDAVFIDGRDWRGPDTEDGQTRAN